LSVVESTVLFECVAMNIACLYR